MCDNDSSSLYFKIASIVSPFISATLSGVLTYFFTVKSKKLDILYQNKIPAFKEITQKLVELKKYCLGQIAFHEGNETSPYYNLSGSALIHRGEIASVAEINALFLSKKSRKQIDDLIAHLGNLSSAELSAVGNKNPIDIQSAYLTIENEVENCINVLYNDLNITRS